MYNHAFVIMRTSLGDDATLSVLHFNGTGHIIKDRNDEVSPWHEAFVEMPENGWIKK
jgi:hypothetical protein